EHFLSDVLGFLTVADHPKHQAEDAILVGVDQLLEGSLVALLEPSDEATIASVPGISDFLALGLATAALEIARRRCSPFWRVWRVWRVCWHRLGLGRIVSFTRITERASGLTGAAVLVVHLC